ncbi:MAG: thiamine-monophosphate kinase [Colwellia sp.]|jgi:thiamine-monophosphate kinase
MKEFEVIRRYFTEQVVKRKDVYLGIGDDCALVTPGERQHIAVTTDTLVAGVHFPLNTSPRAIGHKSIAVNLSDLAAMGAEPSWLSLALTLPEIDENWINEFCDGVFDLCEFYNVQLIGGDTTQGPLSITITAQGQIPFGQHISRSGAKAGEWLYVTGEIGAANLALQHIQGKVTVAAKYQQEIQKRLDFPKARVLAGQALRKYATSAIDLSDGLVADLAHICNASGVGANIFLDALPLSAALSDTVGIDAAYDIALEGGDDYELLFSVTEDNRVGMETALANTGNKITCIGQLNGSGKITTTLNKKAVDIKVQSYQHFSDTPSNK